MKIGAVDHPRGRAERADEEDARRAKPGAQATTTRAGCTAPAPAPARRVLRRRRRRRKEEDDVTPPAPCLPGRAAVGTAADHGFMSAARATVRPVADQWRLAIDRPREPPDSARRSSLTRTLSAVAPPTRASQLLKRRRRGRADAARRASARISAGVGRISAFIARRALHPHLVRCLGRCLAEAKYWQLEEGCMCRRVWLPAL